MFRKPWTKNDLSLLRRLRRRRRKPEVMAVLLGRSVRSIYNKLHNLGLSDPQFHKKTPPSEKARRAQRALCAVPELVLTND